MSSQCPGASIFKHFCSKCTQEESVGRRGDDDGVKPAELERDDIFVAPIQRCDTFGREGSRLA